MATLNKRKSSKGALIKGMSKRLPSEILMSAIFRIRLKKVMKGFAGIYALYKKDKLYYVGLTKNLFGRIRTHHLRDRHSGKWDEFIIFRIKRVDFLKDIETLITHLVPLEGNRQKGKISRDGDINRILREILIDHKKEIKSIEKALRK